MWTYQNFYVAHVRRIHDVLSDEYNYNITD